jgi:hypothetical protein
MVHTCLPLPSYMAPSCSCTVCPTPKPPGS